MSRAQPLAPFWLLLFGVAALGAGLFGLIDGAVAIPSSSLFPGRIERAAQPAAYWALTLLYLAAGAAFFRLRWEQRGVPHEPAHEPPRRPAPGWARVLAWAGIMGGGLLIAAAVMFHFTLGPIVSLLFVAIFGGGGLLFLLAGIGYLVTGRME